MPVLALADLAVIVLALILMCALVLFRTAIVSIIPNFSIPLVGNLKKKVNDGLTAAIHGIWGFTDSIIGDTWKIIMGTVHFFAAFGESLWHFTEESAKTLTHVFTVYVPREVGNVRTWAKTEITSLDHRLTADITHLEHYVDTHLADLTKTVAHDLAAAEKYTVTEFDKATKVANGLLKSAETYAITEATNAETAAKTAATAALNSATSALHTAIVTVAGAVTALDGTLTADVTALTHEVATITSTTIPAVITNIDGIIDDEVKAGEAAVAGAVAGAIAAAGVGDIDIARWLGEIDLSKIVDIAGLTSLVLAVTGTLAQIATDCVIPNCQNLSPLGSLVKDLGGLLEGGAIVAFMVQLQQDPAGLTAEIESLLNPVMDTTVDAVRSLVGAL